VGGYHLLMNLRCLCAHTHTHTHTNYVKDRKQRPRVSEDRVNIDSSEHSNIILQEDYVYVIRLWLCLPSEPVT